MPDASDLKEWLQHWGPLLGVAGGLVLFFSWVLNDHFKADYQSRRDLLEAARRNRTVVGLLQQVDRGIDNLCEQVRSIAPPFASQHPGVELARDRVSAAMKDLSDMRSRARTLNRLNDHVGQLVNLAAAEGDGLSTSDRAVGEVAGRAERLRARMDESIESTQGTLESLGERSERDARKAEEAIGELKRIWDVEIQPELNPLFRRVIDLLNERERTASDLMRRAARRADWCARAAAVSYVAGTVLVILSQLKDAV